MLKGLVIAASGTRVLKEELDRTHFPWTEAGGREAEGFQKAAERLHAKPEELLCLVETDREEETALSQGFFCVGYLNPELETQRLSGCRILLEGFEEVDAPFLQNVYTRALGLPVQIAETKRLLIREMTLADLDDINALYQESEFTGFLQPSGLDRQEEEEKIRAYITYMYGLYQFGMWVVIEKESGNLIGRVGFGIADYLDFSEIDMGYLIGAQYRRKGYAEEASRAALDYAGRILEFPQVSAYIDSENLISLHLIEKLGFCRKKEFMYQGRGLCRYVLRLSRLWRMPEKKKGLLQK